MPQSVWNLNPKRLQWGKKKKKNRTRTKNVILFNTNYPCQMVIKSCINEGSVLYGVRVEHRVQGGC